MAIFHFGLRKSINFSPLPKNGTQIVLVEFVFRDLQRSNPKQKGGRFRSSESLLKLLGCPVGFVGING